jgi:hypothetical protein
LFYFELQPRQTKTIYLAAAMNDFAFTQLDGKFTTIPGKYTVKFGVERTKKHGMGYTEHEFNAQ